MRLDEGCAESRNTGMHDEVEGIAGVEIEMDEMALCILAVCKTEEE